MDDRATSSTAAHKAGAKVGLCGQAPSDHPEFAEFLVECGIDSISVSPDSFIAVKRNVAAAEAKSQRRRPPRALGKNSPIAMAAGPPNELP